MVPLGLDCMDRSWRPKIRRCRTALEDAMQVFYFSQQNV